MSTIQSRTWLFLVPKGLPELSQKVPEDRDNFGVRQSRRGARKAELCTHNAAEFEIVAVGAGKVEGMFFNTAAAMPTIHAVEVAGELKFGKRQDA